MDIHADGRRVELRYVRRVHAALSLELNEKSSRPQAQAIEHERADAFARVALVPAIKIAEIDLMCNWHDGVTEWQTACALARERGAVSRVTLDSQIDLDGGERRRMRGQDGH